MTPRGAALTEFVLVTPVLVALLLFSLFFAELTHARLEMLAVARFAAWERTRRPSVDLAPTHVKRLVELELHDRAVEGDAAFSTAVPDARYFADLTHVLDGTASQAHRRFGLDRKGQISVDATTRFENPVAPLHLRAFRLRSRHALIARGWNLSDGRDLDPGRGHPLWAQVSRMTHLGLELDPGAVLPAGPLPFAMPHPFGATYAVSRNYGVPGRRRHCDSDPSHPAREGLAELDPIDWPYRRCYETAPFRDQSDYDSQSGSLLVRIFEARGAWFMGCQNPQADDPTTCDGDVR